MHRPIYSLVFLKMISSRAWSSRFLAFAKHFARHLDPREDDSNLPMVSTANQMIISSRKSVDQRKQKGSDNGFCTVVIYVFSNLNGSVRGSLGMSSYQTTIEVQCRRQSPLIISPPRQKAVTKRSLPIRSKRIAAQPLSHIPTYKRGEVLLRQRMASRRRRH
jgi:hypothetical protein